VFSTVNKFQNPLCPLQSTQQTESKQLK
jgi:hypothetical protein